LASPDKLVVKVLAQTALLMAPSATAEQFTFA
jgi:hypothetical protein